MHNFFTLLKLIKTIILKRFLLIAGFIILSSLLHAQDKIIQINGIEIKCKILEVTTDLIKYKLSDQTDNSAQTIEKSHVYMIEFSSGAKEIINNINNEVTITLENKKTFDYEDINYKYMSVITLKNGKRIKAKIWRYPDFNYIKCETKDGFMMYIPGNDIQAIQPVKKRNTVRDIYFFGTDYVWHEHNPYNSSEILNTENGFLSGFAFKLDKCIRNRFRFDFKAELGLGKTNYAGHNLNGIKLKKNDIYTSLKLDANLKSRFYLNKYVFEPYAGLGMHTWMRMIENTTTYTDTSLIYAEDWVSTYSNIGCRIAYMLNNHINVFTNFALMYPLSNSISYAFTSTQTVTTSNTNSFNPGAKPTFYWENGITLSKLRISIFYRNFNFTNFHSVNVAVTNTNTQTISNIYTLYQYPTKAHMLGAHLTFTF
jgi:hypothetical protein